MKTFYKPIPVIFKYKLKWYFLFVLIYPINFVKTRAYVYLNCIQQITNSFRIIFYFESVNARQG